jgi:hypothetical protein
MASGMHINDSYSTQFEINGSYLNGCYNIKTIIFMQFFVVFEGHYLAGHFLGPKQCFYPIKTHKKSEKSVPRYTLSLQLK